MVRARGHDLAVQFEARRFPRGRDQVVHVVGPDAVALGVERDELHAGHGEGLGEAAHDLPLDDHRVDPHPAVVHRDHVQHVPDPGFGVDLDGDDVAGERPGEVGRVVVGVVLQARLHAVRHVAVGGHRAFLDGHAPVRGAAHVEPAQLPLDVLLGHLQQVRGQLAGLGADLPADHGDRGAGHGRAARGVGAHAERCRVGVTLLHGHVIGRDAQLVRDDLGPGRLVALALAARAGAQQGLAGHVHPDLGRVEHLDPEDVVLAAVARAQRLAHRGDADTEQPAVLPGLLLLPEEVLVAHGLEAQLEARAVLTGVEQEAERGAVRELVVAHQVDPAELGLVHAQVVRGGVHHPFLEEHRLGHPERAPVRDPAGRLVRVQPPRGQVRDRNVVTAERRVHEADLELARLRVGEERAVVGQGAHPHAEDLAVAAQRQLAVQVDVPGEAGGDQVPGLVLDPLDRALQQDGSQDGADVPGVDGDLVAEAAADVGGDDPDHVLRQFGDQRDRGPDDVRRLGRHVYGELGRGPVEVRDRAAAFDRAGVRARVVQLQPRDHVRLLEGPVGALGVADFPVVDDVAGLVFLVVPDDGGVRLAGLHRVDDDRQRLVVDLDGLARVLGDVGVIGDDARDLLTLETHLVGGQHGLGVVGQRRHPRQVAGGHHLAGEHQVHPGDLPRLAGVDPGDPRVRDRAAQDLHVQHAGQVNVVGVVALAADEAVVLAALAARAHPADHDLVQCLSHGLAPFSGLVQPADWDRSFSAAQSTDFTMFW